MTASDYVELRVQTGEVSRFVERNDGWWVLQGSLDNWEFSRDTVRGFLTSFEPPGGQSTALGSVLVTARGRRLVVASIVKDQELRVILMPEEQGQKRGANYDTTVSGNDIKLPTVSGRIDHHPQTPLCPWCRMNKVLEPHSFAVLAGGALLMNREEDTGLPDESLDGFLSIWWHGAHNGGEGEDRDTDANIDIAQDVRGGQFEVYFCSTGCLRSYLNYCVDELEKKIRAERASK